MIRGKNHKNRRLWESLLQKQLVQLVRKLGVDRGKVHEKMTVGCRHFEA
jgi:uncharacterized protein YprB with RNaseH-like and TPR domain